MAGNDADARFWDRIARKYAADPIKDMDGYARTLDRTRHYLRGTDVVLELGCGTGTTALWLAPHVSRMVATDLSGEMIAIAREKAAAEACRNAEFAVATPERAPDGPTALSMPCSPSICGISSPTGRRRSRRSTGC